MAKFENGVVNFAVYENATQFLGMAEVTLPEISQITEEMKGAGISGSYNAPYIGQLEAMTLTLNFNTVTRAAMSITSPEQHKIDMRVAQQAFDNAVGKYKITNVKHVAIVTPTKTNLGKIAPASPAEASGEYSVSYFATFIDGAKILEIDVLNFIYMVNGIDYLADVRKALGK